MNHVLLGGGARRGCDSVQLVPPTCGARNLSRKGGRGGGGKGARWKNRDEESASVNLPANRGSGRQL